MPVEQAGHERPVPRQWLQPHEEAAARLDRLLGDAELVGRLQWTGFTGPQYDRFAEELARYGIAVLSAWMYHRTIFERVKKRGFGGLPPLPAAGWDRDDREQLAGDTVVIALRRFRETVLIPHKWDHTKGASLKTFFIGQCLMCFPNPYRSWHGRQSDWERHHVPLPDHADQWIARNQRVDTEVVLAVEVRDALAQLPDGRTRQVLILTAMGFKQQEIAQKLGCTVKAVEMIVRRHRQRLNQLQEQHDAAS